MIQKVIERREMDWGWGWGGVGAQVTEQSRMTEEKMYEYLAQFLSISLFDPTYWMRVLWEWRGCLIWGREGGRKGWGHKEMRTRREEADR